MLTDRAPTLTQRILTALQDGRARRVAQIAREIVEADPSIDYGAVMQSVRNLCQEQARRGVLQRKRTGSGLRTCVTYCVVAAGVA